MAQVARELLKLRAGIDLLNVPYKRTPAAVQQRPNAAVRRSLDSPESAASRQRTGSLPMAFSLDDGRRLVAGEVERWARFTKDPGVQIE